MPTEATHWFRKLMASIPFFADKTRVQFEPISGNNGVIAINAQEQPSVYQALASAAAARKGGVLAITSEEYEDLKKKRGWTPSEAKSTRMTETLRVWENRASLKKPSPPPPAPVVNGAGVAGANPISAPVSGVAAGVDGGAGAAEVAPAFNPAVAQVTQARLTPKPAGAIAED